MRGGGIAIIVGVYTLVILTHIKVKNIERTVDAMAKAMQVEVAK